MTEPYSEPLVERNFTVVTAQGTELVVVATHVIEDESGILVRLYNGEVLVASFRGYNSFYVSE